MNRRGVALAIVLSVAACARSATVETGPPRTAALAEEITAMLRASAESWNAGDLDGFLDDYLDSRETTFIGASGLVHGVDEIRNRYQEGYWSTGAPADLLRFEDIAVRPLGPEHALTTGRYVLYQRDSGRTTATGFFSLVLRRTPRGWKIVHDHSSAAG